MGQGYTETHIGYPMMFLMKKSGANQFQGKSLDEINIDLEQSEKSDLDDFIDENLLQNPGVSAIKDVSNVKSPVLPRQRKFVPWKANRKKLSKHFSVPILEQRHLLKEQNVNCSKNIIKCCSVIKTG